jgi:hypothetical protein
MAVLRKGSSSKQNEGRKMKASGGGEMPVEAVLCGEATQEGEGRSRDRQEAHRRGWRGEVGHVQLGRQRQTRRGARKGHGGGLGQGGRPRGGARG